ncbi:hypothetical protein ACHHYP_10274 [Achlya hypogyna]|uniref:RING-type domain-containing protein n=1 Tax=Achlya hypogyna TaxID=1202772 RepID=A0A1V9YLV2_ACHHY|nr:hypothetical protein ACHHYP_10274 [Achlya hypogyna]
MADDADASAADRRRLQRYAFFSCAAGAVAIASGYKRIAALDAWSLQAGVQEFVASKPSVLALINVLVLCLYGLFHVVAPLLVGTVRFAELVHIREHTLQFVVLRSILLLNTLGALGARDLLAVVAWISLLTLLHALLVLVHLRLDHGEPALARVLVVLLLILVGLLAAAWTVFPPDLCLLTSMEVLMALVKWAHTALAVMGPRFEADAEILDLLQLRAQFYLDALHLSGMIVQYMGVLSLGGFRVSFLDFVLVMNVKRALAKVHGRLAAWKNFRYIIVEIDTQFLDVNDLKDDHGDAVACAICLAPLASAKKLDCGHCFHRHCLHKCFQEQTTNDKAWQCPLCRQEVPQASVVNPPRNRPADLLAEDIWTRLLWLAARDEDPAID